MAPADLQRRLGNRGVSVAVRRRAAGAAAPSAVGSPAPLDAVASDRAKRVLERATEGLDADTRAAAVDAVTDPTVKRAPVGDAGSEEPEPVETPDAAEPAPAEDAADEDGGSPDQPEQAAEGGGARGREQGPSSAGPGTDPDAEPDAEPRAPVVPETGAGALGTDDLVLIDVELAEHERWSGAQGRVGAAASLQRAEFVGEAVGSGFASGVASGAKMGLGMGIATRLVPAIGPALGGAMALHGLIGRDWAETGATIAKFGEGNEDYETLANSIAAVSAVVDTVSQVLTVVNGIVGVVQTAAEVIAGGAVVAAFFTFGATLGVAAVAADVVATCEEMSLAITAVTAALDGINSAILQPCVVLFRALHAFTAQADPRDVEAQGQSISSAAEASGAALGGWIGGKAAHARAKAHAPGEDLPPSQKPEPELPPPASGDGPTVRFEEPVTPAAAADAGSPAASPPPVAATEAPPAAAQPPTSDGEQLTLPHVDGPGSNLRPITAPLKLQPISGTEPIPQGLAPGAIGNYERSVPNPHPAALASQPPGAPGATARGGRMPATGRQAAGVYLEHQTSAAAAHEVLPGHQFHGPQGQRRGGRDTKEALVIALPTSVKTAKDPADAALLGDVRARKARGEDVPAVEVIARSTKITQDAISQSGANVPGQQVSRNFLAEMDQFHDPRFGYQEVRPGEPLPPGHPLADTSPAELDAFLDRTFDPFIVPPESGGSPPYGSSPYGSSPSGGPSSAPPAPDPNQLSFDFGATPAAALTTAPAASTTAPAAVPETSATVPTAAPSVAPSAAPPVRPGSAPPEATGGPLPTSAVVAATGVRRSQASHRAQQEATHRARFTPDNQPAEGVERVNPQYPPPPATPAQIVAMQNEIMNLLTVRVAAEQEAQREGERLDRCVGNQGPIAQTVADTTAGISGVQAHDAAVARRAAVNQEQQQRQQESQSLAAGYPSRAAGFAVLTVPLRAWEGFTSLASHLPGRAGAEMLRMNTEAQQLQEAFGQMAAKMLGVDSAGPSNAQRLQDDQGRLQATGEEAQRSEKRLETASAGAQGLQQANEEALAEATDRRNTATGRAQESGDAAEAREKQADTLAERLRAWAGQHAEARRKAIEETTNRLRSKGRTILGSTER